jgi:hypothetical protein
METNVRTGQIAAGLASITGAVWEIVHEARAVEPKSKSGVPIVDELRSGIVELGRAVQALQGHLMLLLAEGDRLGIAPGGVGPWLATVLDCTEGRARMLAEDARILTAVPELQPELCSGRIGQDTVRALARTVKATRKTGLDPLEQANETLRIAREQGAKTALEQARALEEHTDPGSIEQRHAQQRERSYARFGPAGDGEMCRFEILLDPLRGATLRAAIELQTSAFIRARQIDRTELVPEDVRSTEQMNAEAATRLAQVFLDAPAEQRGAPFSVPTLVVTMQDPAVPEGCAVTAYGALVPTSVLPPEGDPRRSVLEVDGETGILDGQPVDRDPAARLASAAQRVFLTWRDRCCTYSGCDRPITYGLNAHHKTAYARGGATTVGNMALYCSQHHTTVHHG